MVCWCQIKAHLLSGLQWDFSYIFSPGFSKFALQLKIWRCKREPFFQPVFRSPILHFGLDFPDQLMFFFTPFVSLQLSWFAVSCPANSLLVPCTLSKNKRSAHPWSITKVLRVFFIHFSAFPFVCHQAHPHLHKVSFPKRIPEHDSVNKRYCLLWYPSVVSSF